MFKLRWKTQSKNIMGSSHASIVSFGYDKILSEKGGGALMIKNKNFLYIKNFFKKNPEFFEFSLDKKKFQSKI